MDNRSLKLKTHYRNKAEGQIASELIDAGWFVTKKGWPDFFCTNAQGEVMVIEVKGRASDRLKKSQEQVLNFFVAKGIRCYRYAPESGMDEYRG